MRLRSLTTSAAFCAVTAATLAGCGSSPSASPSSSPSNSPTSAAPSPSGSATTGYQRVSPTPTPTAAATGASDLHITSQVRADLVAAGAAARHLTASDFVGLEPGVTFYAFDANTQTYWAGAALKPSPSSYNAQVSSQDDGGYTLFHRTSGGAWVAQDGGMAGPNSGPGAGACVVVPPADVLAIWGWPANSCHPTGG